MVDGVLHNACLRMESSGDSLDELIRARGRRRWFGRGGLAVGGAASLAVGAVLGGVLEGVPVLLPPTASASAAPQVVHGNPDAPGSTELTALRGVVSAARLASQALAAATGGGSPGIAPFAGARGDATPSAQSGPSAPSPSGIVDLSGGSPGTSSGSGSGGQASSAQASAKSAAPSTPVSARPSVVGKVLGTVSQVASSLPVVGSTLSGAVGAVGGAVGGLTSPLGSVTSGGSSSSPLAGVTSTATGAVNCVTSLIGGSNNNCGSTTSALGGW